MFFCQILFSWAVGFSVPYIINPDAANLGAKIGYIFFGVGIIISILVYLYIPETKGLSFEEVSHSATVLRKDGLLVLHKDQSSKVPENYRDLSRGTSRRHGNRRPG